MKKIIIFILILNSFSVNSSGTAKKLSFEEMIAMSDAIALIRIIESNKMTNRFNQIYKKELIVEVLEPIYNMKRGEVFILLGFNGIIGSDLHFDTVGSEAIVLMGYLKTDSDDKKIYNSIGAKYSVYIKSLDNKVEGLGVLGMDTTYDKAISKIKNELSISQNKGN